jgi:hypothetical protein
LGRQGLWLVLKTRGEAAGLGQEASPRALHAALTARGHDVTRTPNEWLARDASGETQLLPATARV